MMLIRGGFVVLAGFGLLTTACAAAPPKTAALKSGPQVGDTVPGPFEPLNINGPTAGEEACLYCRYGTAPVAMIFARELTPEVTALIRQLEKAATGKGRSLEACVIFLSTDASLKKQLAELAQKEKLTKVVLGMQDAAGPKDYAIAKEAAITALLYVSGKVKANHAYRKGEFADPQVTALVADLDKIVK